MFLLITVVTFVMLLISAYTGTVLWYALLVSLVLYVIYALYRKNPIPEIFHMLYSGVKKASIVVQVFIFIGAMTAAFMCSGTLPYIIYQGIQLIWPKYFYVLAFLLSCGVSYLLGTSLGSAGTIGIVLVAIARSSDLNLMITSGAIISGIYFGDRASPMSSSLTLLSAMTNTSHYDNMRMTLQTSIVPLLASAGLFALYSLGLSDAKVSTTLASDIMAEFSLSWVLLLPAAMIFIMCMLKMSVKLAMLCSAVTAGVLAWTVQKVTILEILKSMLFGFSLADSSPLYSIIKGGGVFSMLNAAIVVTLSCAIADVIQGAGFMNELKKQGTEKKISRLGVYLRTVMAAAVTTAIGCNQSIGIVMTSQLTKDLYREQNLDEAEFSKDVSVTAMLIPVLFPWNIAVLIPITIFGVEGIAYMPYLLFPYLMMLWQGVKCRTTKRGHINVDYQKEAEI